MQSKVAMFSGAGTGSADASIIPLRPASDGPGAAVSTCRIQVALAAAGTVQFEHTVDGATWLAVEARNEGTGATGTSTTAAGIYTVDSSGDAAVRAYASASTGAVTITGTVVAGGRGGTADVTLDASENHLGSVGGDPISATATFARANNATPYTIGDVVSNSVAATTLMQFAAAGRAVGKGGYITKARLYSDKKDWVSQMRLYLFTVAAAGVAVPVDNLPMTTIYADIAKRVGYIDFPVTKDDADAANSTGCYAEIPLATPLAYLCDAADTALYGVLVDETGATPAGLQNFSVSLFFDRS